MLYLKLPGRNHLPSNIKQIINILYNNRVIRQFLLPTHILENGYARYILA